MHARQRVTCLAASTLVLGGCPPLRRRLAGSGLQPGQAGECEPLKSMTQTRVRSRHLLRKKHDAPASPGSHCPKCQAWLREGLPPGTCAHTPATKTMPGATRYVRPPRRLSERRACSARQYSSHAPGLAMGASAAQVRACAAAAAASTTPVSLAGRTAPRPDMPRGLPPSSTCTATSTNCHACKGQERVSNGAIVRCYTLCKRAIALAPAVAATT